MAGLLVRFQEIRPESVTLRQFVERKWYPLKTKWKSSTRLTSTQMIETRILKSLGEYQLRTLDRSVLSAHLQTLASEGLSHGVIQHVCSFLKNIMATAVDLDLLAKDPTRFLEIPRSQATRTLSVEGNQFAGKPYLTIPQIHKLLCLLEGKSRTAVMFSALMALRPGEVFGLKWHVYKEGMLTILERVYKNAFDLPKTRASMAQLPVPRVLREEIEKWRLQSKHTNPFDLIFPSKNPRIPLRMENFNNRILKPLGSVIAPFPVTWAILRRSWATNAPQFGASVREIECVLRHSSSVTEMAGVYIQPIRERVQLVLDAFADAVIGEGLPEHAEIPIERAIVTTESHSNASNCVILGG